MTQKLFSFLVVKGFVLQKGIWDRSGLPYTIKAFYEEFSSKDSCQLLVKVNMAYSQQQFTLQDILKLTNTPEKPDAPIIKFSFDNIDYKNMPSIYQNADILVNIALAEGFALNVLEGMACGLPSIVNSFGGHMDFCNEQNSWIIDGELKEIPNDILYEGISWQIPDITKLKEVMRYAYSSKEEIRKKSQEALRTAQQFTWQNTALKIIEEIKKI